MSRSASQSYDEHNRRQREYFEKTDKPRMVPTGSPYTRRQVEQLVQFARLTPGERVLEVGCGMGRYTLLLAERGLDVTGLDLSQALLDRLAAYNQGRYPLALFSADILEPPGELYGQFDAIAGFFTLHHLHDIPRSLASMRSLLKATGRIIFLEPNAFNPLYYVQIALTPGMSWQGDGGIVKMRPGYILPAMRQAGLMEAQVSRFGFFPPFIANTAAGTRLEPILERFPLWRRLLPFQLFMAVKR